MATKTRLWSDSPAYPGELLNDELAARDLTIATSARTMDIAADELAAVCRGERAVTAPLAWALETLLGDISARFWMGLQADYNLAIERNRRAG